MPYARDVRGLRRYLSIGQMVSIPMGLAELVAGHVLNLWNQEIVILKSGVKPAKR
jgi:hypothetical protein